MKLAHPGALGLAGCTLVSMTTTRNEYRVDGGVLAARPGKPAASLVSQALESQLRRVADRAEYRGEVIDWTSLRVTAAADGAGVVLYASLDHGATAPAPGAPAAPGAGTAALVGLEAEVARLRGLVSAADERAAGAALLLRTMTPTDTLRRAHALLVGEGDGEDERPADAYRS